MQLKIRQLTKKYGEKVALENFSYTFEPGIYGILGTNGAGKSTLMNLITDNVERTEGSIYWNGKEILKLKADFRRLVGYMPQQQGMYDDFSAVNFSAIWPRSRASLPRRPKPRSRNCWTW